MGKLISATSPRAMDLDQEGDATCGHADDSDKMDAANVLFSIYFVIAIVWGIFGNLFIMVSIATFKRLRSVANVFVFNLAAADLIMTSFVMPLTLANMLHGGLAYGEGLCAAASYLLYLSAALSVYNLVFIAFNRFVGVCYPATTYSRTFRPRHTALMVAGIWACCLVATSPPLYTNWAKQGYIGNEFYCGFLTHEIGWLLYIMGGAVVLPASLIFYFYFKIFLKIRESERRIRKQASSSCVTNHSGVKKRATFTMFLIVILFVAFWAPVAIVSVILIGMATDLNKYVTLSSRVTTYLGFSNSCINSIVLISRSRDYNYAFKRMACFWRSRHAQSSSHQESERKSLGQTTFVSENLTARRQNLLFKCRQLKREKNLKQCWSTNGNIKARLNNDEIVNVNDIDELHELINFTENTTVKEIVELEDTEVKEIENTEVKVINDDDN